MNEIIDARVKGRRGRRGRASTSVCKGDDPQRVERSKDARRFAQAVQVVLHVSSLAVCNRSPDSDGGVQQTHHGSYEADY